MRKAILFDLDGTLTESGEGIIKSVQYALDRMGRPEKDAGRLRVFIGPPLTEQFMKYAGLDRAEAETALGYYRERYSTIGIFENRPYPGIKEMLDELKAKGYRLAVASSKPERFVAQILEHFWLDGCFEHIVGATMDEKRTDKADVIEEALARLEMTEQRDLALMVGDKEHDVFGARAAGIRCVAVTYGYGTPEELEEACPFKTVDTVEQLGACLSAF